jgi:hypothetical protein
MSATINVRTLPIRLDPISGEALDSWLFAYADRLDTPLIDLADATGLSKRFVRQPARAIALGTGLGDANRFAAAAGIDPATIHALWQPLARHTKIVKGGRFSRSGLLQGLVPMPWSRYCPACLAIDGHRWKAAWRLAWHTTCAVHRRLLLDACPACGRHPRVGPLAATDVDPRLASRCRQRSVSTIRHVCDADLTAPSGSTNTDLINKAIELQAAVAPLHAPHTTTAAHRTALDILGDLLLIVGQLWVNAPAGRGPKLLAAPVEIAPVLATAWDMYTGDAQERFPDIAAGACGPGVLPRRWSVASPSLVAPTVSRRDTAMRITDRLRWRSTTTPQRPTTDELEALKVKARHVPEALWADWAVRLTPKMTADTSSFRVACAAALLIPGTPRPLTSALSDTPHQGRARQISHVLANIPPIELTDILRALTELAQHLTDGPIDHQRRRELAASVELLAAPEWKRVCSTAGIASGAAPRLNHARLWIYETLTGSPPHSAPTAIRPRPHHLVAYHRFALRLPALAAELLEQHARNLLAAHNISEPLTWSPPRHWVSAKTLPGREPDDIDLDTIRQALRHLSPQTAADQLGISLEHLRLAVRRHHPQVPHDPASAPQQRNRSRRPMPFPLQLSPERLSQLILDEQRSVRSIAADYGLNRKTITSVLKREGIPIPACGRQVQFVIDPDWLRAQYLEHRRTLPDIARQVGATDTTIARIARKHGIQVRPRGGARHIRALTENR